MHERLEGEQDHAGGRRAASFASVIVQIMLLDIVFSLDSVITAVGMVDEVAVMVAAVIVSAGIMMLSAESISAFVHKHPTVKMLALSFLLLIGMSLLLEGFGQHIPKGYIYFAMGFSVFVEMINLRIRAKSAPVRLREPVCRRQGGPRLKRIPGARRLLKDCRTVLNRCLFPEDFATMKRLSVALLVACLATVPLVAQQPAASPSTQPPPAGTTWKVDTAHSSAGFSVKHMMVATVRGTLGPISGTVDYDGKDVSTIKADITIDVTKINTGNESRDKDLRDTGFFEVAKYPTMKFKSKRVEPGSPGQFKMIGDLTMHGVTKEVTLDVEGPSPVVKVQNGGQKVGATATTKVNRRDFGLNYNSMIEAGAVVGDQVTVTIDIEINR